MSDALRAGISRRRLLRTAGTAVAGAAALGRFSRAASTHDLRPTDPQYRLAENEAIVNPFTDTPAPRWRAVGTLITRPTRRASPRLRPTSSLVP